MGGRSDRSGHIIFGLGSGRSGTASLAGLLNAQPGTVCFHEANPAAMSWEGAEDTVISQLRDFHAILQGDTRAVTIDLTSPDRCGPVARLKALGQVTGIGDVAHYHLPYVETILAHAPQARFPCILRDREEMVQSFTAKLRLAPPGRARRLWAFLRRRPLPRSRNHWAGPQDRRWQGDLRFDKCFPSYEGMATADLATHLRRWHRDYYTEVERLQSQYPDHIRLFDISCLNDADGRRTLLDFCLPGGKIAPDVTVHANSRSATA